MPKRKILVVDDDMQFQMLGGLLLGLEGYDVRLADDPEKAITAMQGKGFHVAFIGLNLRGNNGVELGSLIRNNKPMSILYAVTGFPSLSELSHCRDAGFDDYFVKPFRPEIFLKATEEAFEKIERWKMR